MATFKVTSSVLEKEHDFGDGKMHQYLLDLTDQDSGETFQNVNHWNNPKYDPFLDGDTVTGEITSQKGGGLKLAQGRRAGAGGGAPRKASGGGRSGGGRTDDTGRSIERQVAVKAAAEIGSALIAAGKTFTSGDVVALAGKLADFMAQPPAPAPTNEAPAPAAPTEAAPAAPADDEDIPF